MNIRYCLLLLLLAGKSSGQPVELRNPSFEEDVANTGTTPTGWYDCGSPLETPPDIQPGSHGVELPAANGDNYISLVVRDNGSTEAIGQYLSQPLKKDSIYLLSRLGARSLQMTSPTKKSKADHNYSTPARLRVWGGNEFCEKKELLAESAVIISPFWAQLQLVLQPDADVTYLLLEADYKKSSIVFMYNGNVLIDNLSLSQIP